MFVVGAAVLGDQTRKHFFGYDANAVENALGVRLRDMPLTRDKLIAAIAA